MNFCTKKQDFLPLCSGTNGLRSRICLEIALDVEHTARTGVNGPAGEVQVTSHGAAAAECAAGNDGDIATVRTASESEDRRGTRPGGQ